MESSGRATDVSQRLSGDHLAFEEHQNERGAGDEADSAGAGGDVLERFPSAGKQNRRGPADLTSPSGGVVVVIRLPACKAEGPLVSLTATVTATTAATNGQRQL